MLVDPRATFPPLFRTNHEESSRGPKKKEEHMKRGTWKSLIVGGALLGAMVPALAFGNPRSGHIVAGHPATWFVGGVTEIVAPCEENSTFDGIDGVWFNISGSDGLELILIPDLTLDADAWFYDAGCDLLDGEIGVLDEGLIGVPVSGFVPSGAAWVIIDGFAGSGNFEFTIS